MWDIGLQKHMLIKNGGGAKATALAESRADPGGVRFHPLCGMLAVCPLGCQCLKDN